MAAVPPINPRSSTRTHATVDISTAVAATSDVINLTGMTLAAISMPASWTDARLAFKASVTNSTSVLDVYDTAGNFLTYPTSANRVVAFDPAALMGLQTLQIVSATSAGTPVAQAGVRTLTLSLIKQD